MPREQNKAEILGLGRAHPLCSYSVSRSKRCWQRPDWADLMLWAGRLSLLSYA